MQPAAVAWPVEADFTSWLGSTYTEAPDAALRATEAFLAADGLIRVSLDEDDMGIASTGPIVYECYGPIRQAILIYAGRLFSRKDTLTGALSFGGDSIMQLRRNDPDVYSLIEPWTGVSV
tara:strand:+ start:621 stop:980 length:360 start_codon:yes stop_codon:yes gene_type:complete